MKDSNLSTLLFKNSIDLGLNKYAVNEKESIQLDNLTNTIANMYRFDKNNKNYLPILEEYLQSKTLKGQLQKKEERMFLDSLSEDILKQKMPNSLSEMNEMHCTNKREYNYLIKNENNITNDLIGVQEFSKPDNRSDIEFLRGIGYGEEGRNSYEVEDVLKEINN